MKLKERYQDVGTSKFTHIYELRHGDDDEYLIQFISSIGNTKEEALNKNRKFLFSEEFKLILEEKKELLQEKIDCIDELVKFIGSGEK